MGISRLPPVGSWPKWLVAGSSWRWNPESVRSHELYEVAIGLVLLNSNSEMHMTAICDARLIYGKGCCGFHGYLYAVGL